VICAVLVPPVVSSAGSGRLCDPRLAWYHAQRSLLRPALFLAGHLVLQRKRADCGIASPVIAALCGQHADRQSEHERGGGDDYAFGHHGSPLSF
jgi:hypothetical protein